MQVLWVFIHCDFMQMPCTANLCGHMQVVLFLFTAVVSNWCVCKWCVYSFTAATNKRCALIGSDVKVWMTNFGIWGLACYFFRSARRWCIFSFTAGIFSWCVLLFNGTTCKKLLCPFAAVTSKQSVCGWAQGKNGQSAMGSEAFAIIYCYYERSHSTWAFCENGQGCWQHQLILASQNQLILTYKIPWGYFWHHVRIQKPFWHIKFLGASDIMASRRYVLTKLCQSYSGHNQFDLGS